jgi:glucose-6-phosphate 1-dehydrogenase
MKETLKQFLSIVTYISGQYDADESFQNLAHGMNSIEAKYEDSSIRNRVFYMALPPSVFVTVARCLKRNCYSNDGINRIIVEKPFGSDLESSREMQRELKKEFNEDEVR